MTSKKFFRLFIILILLAFSGCIKKPEKVFSPSIKIDVVSEKNDKKYMISFTGGIKNRNSDTVFMDFKSSIKLVDPDRGGSEIIKLYFTLDRILPFSTGIIETRNELSPDQLQSVLTVFGFSREKLDADKSISRNFIDQKFFILNIDDYKTEDIVKILKGKTDEKN